MANVEHEALAYGEQHVFHFAEYANSTLREAATGLTSGDDHKVALQTDDHSYWILTDYTGPTWVPMLGTPGDDTVTGAKIVDDAIDSEHYTDGSIDLAHMSANSIDSDQYVDGSIDAAHLATDAVETAKIKDLNVTAAKIAQNAVTNYGLAVNAVYATHITTDAVETAKIKDANVTAAKMEGAIPETGGNSLKGKVIDIGTWDMDASTQKSVAHGLTVGNIRSVDVIIRKDDNSEIYKITNSDSIGEDGYIAKIDATNVVLRKTIGGDFDNTDFDTMGDDGNRGWITIWYKP